MSDTVIEINVRDVSLRQYVPNEILRFNAECLSELEPETLSWIDSFTPGSVYYDVGASTGPYAHYAIIKTQADSICFEAEGQNFAVLQMNSWLNKERLPHQPKAFNIAISDQCGTNEIYCAKYEAGYHMKILGQPVRVGESVKFEPDHVQHVMTISLDDAQRTFGLPCPHYLKVDVDGAEREVIQGAVDTLGNPQLKSIMIELHDPDGSSADIVSNITRTKFKFAERFPVRNARGGYYQGLFNCLFLR